MEITDPVFREAVVAIDTGNISQLEKLVNASPRLLHDRLSQGNEGYFKDPFLLWFVAGNPVRNEKLPPNIIDAARVIILAAERAGVKTLRHQLNYTLALISSGRVARECDVQRSLIDLFVNKGAEPDQALNAAIVHGELDAVEYLVKKGARLTLPAAIALKKKDDVRALLRIASKDELQVALAMASFYGHAGTVAALIAHGAEVNTYNPQNFHSHSMPIHQAVFSGSLDAVRILVDAGADLYARDKVYNALPLGWAIHAKQENRIADYLREQMARKMAQGLLDAALITPEKFEDVVTELARRIEV